MSCANGRVDILKQTPPDISNLFQMFDKIPASQCTSLQEPTMGLWNETALSKAFFSANNISIIQNGIRAGVYYKSNKQYVIEQQDCDSLKIIMRSIFLQHAANQTRDITGQIEQLNQIVLNYCILQVYQEAIGYKKYLRDVSTIPDPISQPICDSQMDRKDFKLKPWF